LVPCSTIDSWLNCLLLLAFVTFGVHWMLARLRADWALGIVDIFICLKNLDMWFVFEVLLPLGLHGILLFCPLCFAAAAEQWYISPHLSTDFCNHGTPRSKSCYHKSRAYGFFLFWDWRTRIEQKLIRRVEV